MDRYIGLDAHASSCTVGVVSPSGKRLSPHMVETNGRALIEVLRDRGLPRSGTRGALPRGLGPGAGSQLGCQFRRRVCLRSRGSWGTWRVSLCGKLGAGDSRSECRRTVDAWAPLLSDDMTTDPITRLDAALEGRCRSAQVHFG